MIDSRTFYNFANAPLYIGYHGENLVTGVDIDLAGVLPDGWGAGLLLRRPGEGREAEYEAVSALEGSTLRATFETFDTMIEGCGEATIELRGPNGEKKKSDTAQTVIPHALDLNGIPPERPELYRTAAQQDVIDAGKLSKAAQAAKTADMTQPVGVDDDGKLWALPGGGSGSDELWRPTVDISGNISWEKSTSETPPATQNIKGQQGTPGRDGQDGRDGTDGADGYSPDITISQITGGHTVNITDKQHPSGQTFNVMDGTDGQDGSDAEVTAENIEAALGYHPAAPDGYYGESGGVFEYSTNFIGKGAPTNENNIVFRPTASQMSGQSWGTSHSVSGEIATIEKIKGKTLVFNQQLNVTAESGTSGDITFTKNSDGSWTVTGTTTSNNHFYNLNYAGAHANANHFIVGHKYFIGGISSDNKVYLYTLNDGAVPNSISALTGIGVITSLAEATWARIQIGTSLPIGTNINATIYPQIVDLTQMFGAGNEPATVEEFKAMFPLDYYEYNPGELVSFNGTGLKTVGFNAYHNGTAELIGGIQYQITGAYTALSFGGETITPDSGGVFTVPKNGTLTVTGGDGTTCIHLVWSGLRNGEYEPHWDSTLALPISTYFPDGMKSAVTVYDELTKDKAIKRIGKVDLGSLSWGMDGARTFSANLPNNARKYANVTDVTAGVIAKEYKKVTWVSMYGNRVNKTYAQATNRDLKIIDDDYSSVADFKAAMSGVLFYYELETPVETPISPALELNYKVDDFGTEMLLPQNDDEPVTAPMDAEIVYHIDYEGQVRNNDSINITKKSMDSFISAYNNSGAGTISQTWDDVNKKYNYNVTSDMTGKIDKSSQAAKTADMTQPVGIDADGKLWAKEGGSGGLLPQLIISAITGASIAITKGSYSRSYIVDSSSVLTADVPEYGTYTITGVFGGETLVQNVEVNDVKQYDVTMIFGEIYGVEWGRVSSPVWTRTDDAALFADPVPFVNNGMAAGDCSSPFDDIMPWAGMVRVSDPDAGELVAIPKFYYRWDNDATKMKLQISTQKYNGFHTSPAHMDRGDGKGERDVVYVGRYHCATSDYKSRGGEKPKANITRAAARTAIHNLGENIWHLDHALWWTIDMLYLVEFANPNCQGTIGYGRGNRNSTENMGYTDTMPYHTGSMKENKTVYGVSTQYRNIEGLWDNVVDWCDGIYFKGNNVYHIINPANFSDTTGGTLTGTRATVDSKVITGFTFPALEGFEWAGYPSYADIGSDSTTGSEYFCDNEYCSTNGVVLYVGGYYLQNQSNGLFCLGGGYDASRMLENVGARLQKLP